MRPAFDELEHTSKFGSPATLDITVARAKNCNTVPAPARATDDKLQPASPNDNSKDDDDVNRPHGTPVHGDGGMIRRSEGAYPVTATSLLRQNPRSSASTCPRDQAEGGGVGVVVVVDNEMKTKKHKQERGRME